MSARVEILFFGRPEGLESTQSLLLQGLEDSLYPEQGMAEASQDLIWRVQFFNQPETQLQVLSCFKAMGSPTRGAGGFIGIAAVMNMQFQITSSLTMHLERELTSFINAVTNGVQFVSAQKTAWPVPVGFTETLGLRDKLYAAVGGKPSFIGGNLDASRNAEQIEHAIRNNFLQGATTAHFMGTYSGHRPDWVDLNAEVKPILANEQGFSAGGDALALELEIRELKQALAEAQSELVRANEKLLSASQSAEQARSESVELKQQMTSLKSSRRRPDAPRPVVWLLLGFVGGLVVIAGVYFLLTLLTGEESAGDATPVPETTELRIENKQQKPMDDPPRVFDILKERPLTTDELVEKQVMDDLFFLSGYPSGLINEDLLEHRYQSILAKLKSYDPELDEVKLCVPCIKYNVPNIQLGAMYQQSALNALSSSNRSVQAVRDKLVKHAEENPLFQQNRKWKLQADESASLDASSGKFEETRVSKMCDEARLPIGDLKQEIGANLCWHINRYAFGIASNAKKEQYFFSKWSLPKRD